MKILTTVTASAGLDVASTGSDTIKLGSANTENNIIDKIEVLENYQNLLNNNSSI
jgi:hypothetical protein